MALAYLSVPRQDQESDKRVPYIYSGATHLKNSAEPSPGTRQQ